MLSLSVSSMLTSRIQHVTFEQLNKPELQRIKSVVMAGGFSNNVLVEVILSFVASASCSYVFRTFPAASSCKHETT